MRHFNKIPTFRKVVSVRENLHSMFGLAFIPEDDFVASWAELKPLLSVNPSLLPVLDYVESTWIFNDIYPIHMWNVYRAVINNEPCTNNFVEGHNHALQLAAGCSHPGIELLIETLTLYNTDAELNIQQALSGTVMVPRQKKKYAKLAQKIFNAMGYYGRVDTEMNCRTLGHLNHKRQ